MKKLLLPVLFALTILSCTKGETPEGGDETQSGGQTEQPQQPEQPQPEDPQQPEQPQQPENPEQGGISGAGTETSPYILKTADDFKTVRGLITPATTTYIQLAANINMSGVTDYVPFNHEEPFDRQIHFDGKGHTISNFTCSDAACPYPSIFGVLYGSCRDLNVERPSVTATGQVCGVIAGYVGTAGKPGLVEKVTVTNAVVNSACERAGGICGHAYEAIFNKVSFQGTVISTVTAMEAKAGGFVGQTDGTASFADCSADVIISAKQSDVGGFAGKVTGTASFATCKVKAAVTSFAAQKNRVGGLIGWNSSVKTTIVDCHVLKGTTLTDKSGRTTTASNGNYGGLIGFGDTDGTTLEIADSSVDADIYGGSSHYNSLLISALGYASVTTITKCVAKGDVNSEVGNYTAGLIGSVNAKSVLTVTDCCYSGNVSATGGYVGGIIGGTSGKMTLSTTCSIGTVTAVGNYTGGLVGASMNDAVTISDCYSSAKVHGRGQQVGGLVGTTTNRLTMSDCYASGDVYSGTSGAAGIVGRVAKSSSISNCIAWNRNIGCSRGANNVYAPGAVLGCAQEAGTYKGCWRRSDMVLTDPFVSLCDQEDFVNAAPPLPSYSTATHQQSYHGKAAPAGETLASLAKSLGWDAGKWNFAEGGTSLGFTIKQLGNNKIEF